MKARKTFRIILCVVTVLSMVFALTACGEDNVIVSNPTTTVNNNVDDVVNTTQNVNSEVTTTNQNNYVPDNANTTTQVQTTVAVQVNEPDMCYWCGELPVGDFETYCVNCRCIKCDDLRKDGGRRYIYCSDHNCNENNCEEPAVEDSQYCVLHKCNNPDCDFEKTANSEYCYHHSR